MVERVWGFAVEVFSAVPLEFYPWFHDPFREFSWFT